MYGAVWKKIYRLVSVVDDMFNVERGQKSVGAIKPWLNLRTD